MPDVETSLQAELAAANIRIAELENERDLWRGLAESREERLDTGNDLLAAAYARADAAEAVCNALWWERHPYSAEDATDASMAVQRKLDAWAETNRLARLDAEPQKETIMDTNFLTFNTYDVALDYARRLQYPITIKCVGLERGWGIIICQTPAEAEQALKQAMLGRKFGAAGDKVRIYGDLQPPAIPAADFDLEKAAEELRQWVDSMKVTEVDNTIYGAEPPVPAAAEFNAAIDIVAGEPPISVSRAKPLPDDDPDSSITDEEVARLSKIFPPPPDPPAASGPYRVIPNTDGVYDFIYGPDDEPYGGKMAMAFGKVRAERIADALNMQAFMATKIETLSGLLREVLAGRGIHTAAQAKCFVVELDPDLHQRIKAELKEKDDATRQES